MDQEKKQKEALAKIKELTKEAKELITKAEKIADEAGVSFYFAVDYGMGGTYHPTTKEENSDNWCSSDDKGWVSSDCY